MNDLQKIRGYGDLIRARGAEPVARALRPRADHENPRRGNCPLHLQRICGTCAHFTAPLRPGADDPKTAVCPVRDLEVSARRKAWACPAWSRKQDPAP